MKPPIMTPEEQAKYAQYQNAQNAAMQANTQQAYSNAYYQAQASGYGLQAQGGGGGIGIAGGLGQINQINQQHMAQAKAYANQAQPGNNWATIARTITELVHAGVAGRIGALYLAAGVDLVTAKFVPILIIKVEIEDDHRTADVRVRVRALPSLNLKNGNTISVPHEEHLQVDYHCGPTELTARYGFIATTTTESLVRSLIARMPFYAKLVKKAQPT